MIESQAFEPDFLRRLDRLALGIKRARTRRIGERAVGRVQGTGLELENFRNYAEGDDLRFLDWSALARFDELLIRTYRANRQVEVTVLVDTSASMNAPRGDDKLGLALLLAAAIAYIAMGENDPVRLATFALRRGAMRLIRTPFYFRRESYPELRSVIAAVRGGGTTRLGAMIDQLMLERRPAGLALIISDFLTDEADYKAALDQLIGARYEVGILHVMGERELAGNYPDGLLRVRDAESGALREVAMTPETTARYRRRVEEFIERLREFCTRRGIIYVPAFGAANFERIITQEFPRLGLVD
jgi:uncharacterized protein (DUF58 family)